jgi:hypothetical protein
MEGLLGHLEHLKTTAPTPNKRLREAVMNSWAKLQEYYQLTDGSYSIYAAATLFHPPPRMKHFTREVSGQQLRLQFRPGRNFGLRATRP